MQFATEAGKWDTHRRIQRAEALAERIYEEIRDKRDAPVLEYGCGTGLISLPLHDRLADITLMDSSPEMIRELSVKVLQGGIRNMHPMEFDLTKCRYMDRRFGAIYTSMALHHIPDTRQILRALYQLLDDKGILCVVDLDEDDGAFHSAEQDFIGHNGFRRETIFCMFQEAGLVDVAIHTVFQGQKSIGARTVPYSLFCITGCRP